MEVVWVCWEVRSREKKEINEAYLILTSVYISVQGLLMMLFYSSERRFRQDRRAAVLPSKRHI